MDLSHSQPFWGHGYPDLAIVHNGHITNYHQLRRRYEQRGMRFYTENDSEIIAIYLAAAVERRRRPCSKPLSACSRDLDGSFSCLVATASELGFVKDQFSLKPLVFRGNRRFRGDRHRGNRHSRRAPRQLQRAGGPGQGSAHMAEVACDGRGIRARSTRKSGRLIAAGQENITVTNPGARHNLGVAILAPCARDH